MSCNCNNPAPCNNCTSGIPCNCPPDYGVVPVPVPCHCCPSGYTYTGTSQSFPSGYCTSTTSAATIAAIQCNTCVDSISTDCVVYQCINPQLAAGCRPCANVAPGDSMTTILGKICPTNPAVILQMLQVIAADTQYGLKQAFCDIVNLCSFVPGSLTPYLGPASFTIP